MHILMTDSEDIIKYPYDKIYKSAYLDAFSGNSFFKFDDYSAFLSIISIMKENKECDLVIDFDRNRSYGESTKNDIVYNSNIDYVNIKGHIIDKKYDISYHFIPNGENKHSDKDIYEYYAENKDKSKLIPSWFYQKCNDNPCLVVSKVIVPKESVGPILDTFDRMNMNGYALTRFSMMTWNPLSTIFPSLLGGIK